LAALAVFYIRIPFKGVSGNNAPTAHAYFQKTAIISNTYPSIMIFGKAFTHFAIVFCAGCNIAVFYNGASGKKQCKKACEEVCLHILNIDKIKSPLR
jgi:hypothetical protein